MFRRSMFVKCLMGVIVLTAFAANLNASAIAENWDTGYTTNEQVLNSPWIDANPGYPQHQPLGASNLASWSGSWSASTTGTAEVRIRGVASRPTGALSTDIDVVATAVFKLDNVDYSAYSRLALSPYAMASGNDGWEHSSLPGSLSINYTEYPGETASRFQLYYVKSDGTLDLQTFLPAALGTGITDWVAVRLSMPHASGGSQSALFEWKLASASSWNTLGSVALDSSFSAANLGFGFTHEPSVTRMWMDDVTFSSAPIPEPGTLVLLGCGLVSLLAYAWRKRR